MMTARFAFLGYNNECKCRAATAVTTFGVLLFLLLPASLGYGGTIAQEASGQFALPQLEEPTPPEEDTTPPPTTPTTPTTAPATTTNYTNNIRDPSIFLLRGLIGSYLPPQGAIGGGGAITPAAADDSGHVVTGRFRVFANETLIRRFVAEMDIAAIDGSSFHNITITESAPHRFQVTEGGNGTTTSVPIVSSNILGTIYLDSGATPIIDNVPMTLTVRGQSLAIQGIDIDVARIADTGQRDAISVIDGQSIYGIVP
jgi:hypothetical protein